MRETLFNMAMKSAKESVQAEYPKLKQDFLVVKDDNEVEDTQSETANLGANGKKITPDNDEAIDQVLIGDKNEDGKMEKKGDGVVDIHLFDE